MGCPVPLEVLAEVTATVQSDEPPRSIDARVEDSATDRTIDGAWVSTYVRAFDGETTLHGYRVRIDGEDITPDIVGAVEHSENGYTGEHEVRFTLRGARWSIFRSYISSTMLAPVLLEVAHGATAVEMVEDPPVHLRIVEAEQRKGDGHNVLVDVVALDELSARAATQKLCFEVAPRSGLSVGAILRSIYAGVPIASEIQDGRTFKGRVQETGTSLLDRTYALQETEGWFRRLRDGVVRVTTMEPRAADEAPDWRLTPARWNDGSQLDAGAPQEVPYRYVVRGETSVEIDGDVEVIRDEFEQRGLFAPEYALLRQVGGLNNPDTVAVPINPPTASDRLISRITTERRIRAGLPEVTTVTEFGWTWTEAALAYLEPPNKHQYIAGRYVDSQGLGRLDPVQTFRVVRKTETRWTYGPRGEEVSRVVSVTENVLRDKPVLRPSNPDAVEVDGYLYGDGRSYADASALQDKLSEKITYRKEYGADDRVTFETAERRAYYLEAARNSGAIGATAPPVLLNKDGNGQVQGIARFQKTEDSRITYFSTHSGQRDQSAESRFGYRVRPDANGDWEVNGVKTNDAVELYGELTSDRKTESYRRITKFQTEVTPWTPGELPRTTTVLAPMPINPGIPSAWTTTRTQPLAYFEQDPDMIELYGAHSRVIQSDFADDLDVLRRLARQAWRRDRAIKASVNRRLSPIATGDTVDILDASAGMETWRRALCIGKDRSMSPTGFEERLTFEVERSAS